MDPDMCLWGKNEFPNVYKNYGQTLPLWTSDLLENNFHSHVKSDVRSQLQGK